MDHKKYMAEALCCAREAYDRGEVPVGCVIARNDEIIASGYNRREGDRCALSHAETLAIAAACRVLGGWRLPGCALYVTLEPCAMCAGAIINARIPVVVYGAKDAEMGACGSMINLFEEGFSHRPRLYGGVMAEECAGLLRDFFRGIR